MTVQIVNLSPASSSEANNALDEVRDFRLTDMDRGGPKRWTYRMLDEPHLTAELRSLAAPRSVGAADSVSFQPCKTYQYRSQDRYDVAEWALPSGTWSYAAVFDGHMNHDTVEHVSAAAGERIRNNLDAALRSRPAAHDHDDAVRAALRSALTATDDALVADFLALFPADLSTLPDARARALVNDNSAADGGLQKTARAFGGSTALAALLDPAREHLWVANVGDCVAVLASRAAPGAPWRGRVLNAIHNGGNAAELARIRAAHPGEADCTWNDRVLGFLAPTRALGDAWLKLPARYAELVFRNLDADWFNAASMEQHVPRIRTPPYLSSEPDVYHVDLREDCSERVLIMCSDGLSDLYDGYSMEQMAEEWAQTVGKAVDAGAAGGNLALALLREAIGGADAQLVSRNLTVEMEDRWMDDTTIIVQRLTSSGTT